MEKTKAARSRSFRASQDTERRLEYADKLGIDISELVREVLDKHLREHLVLKIQATKAEIEKRQKLLKEAAVAPCP